MKDAYKNKTTYRIFKFEPAEQYIKSRIKIAHNFVTSK